MKKLSTISSQEKYALILQDREKHIDEPMTIFCKKHGISLWTYYYWKKRLGKFQDRSLSPKKFTPVTLEQPAQTAFGKPYYSFRFPNGAALLISEKMDPVDLSRLMLTVADIRV
jgi:hypothetical protein